MLCHSPRPKCDQSSQTLSDNEESRTRQRMNRCDVPTLYSPVNCPTIRRNDHLPSEHTEIQVHYLISFELINYL